MIKLRFEGTSAPLFFVFSGFTLSPIFPCFNRETDRTLYKSAFISPQSSFYSKCKNNPLSNEGAGFTHIGIIPQQNDFVFCFHFDWCPYMEGLHLFWFCKLARMRVSLAGKKQGEHHLCQAKPSFSGDQSLGESQNII